MDKMTLDDLEYLIGSHYCNKLGQSDLVCGLIKHAAAEARILTNMKTTGHEITIPQGWFGGSAGISMVVPA